MEGYDSKKIPHLDDESEENFDRVNSFIDSVYEKAKQEAEEK